MKNNKTKLEAMVPIIYDALHDKSKVLKENANKSGISKIINRITGDSYVGKSINLSRKFNNYYNLKYLDRESKKKI